MKRILFGAALLLSAPAFADALAIERALGGVEWQDGPSKLRLLGDQPDLELLTVLQDGSAAPLRRRRALAMLVYVNTPRVRTFVKELFAKRRDAIDGTEALELAALLPVAARLGQVDYDSVLPLLFHPVANLRESAVAALYTIDRRRTRIDVRTRLLTETDSGVRLRMTKIFER